MIEFQNVSKRFGSAVALDDFSHQFLPGKIIGLFGPNGAGKSTTLKMIAGLNRPDRGQVLVDSRPPQEVKSQVAFLPEIDHFYNWMNIKQAAHFLRSFYPDWDQQRYRQLIHYLNLSEDMKVSSISKGQRAKVKLLLTLSRKASFVLMDEPLSGIDVLTREEIISTLIQDFRAGEQTIIISTHEIAEIEAVIDEVVFIDHGSIKLKGNAEDLRQERAMSLVDIMKEEFRHAG
ncbi:MAG: ATP-binding cassette domain-containing protein [Syntrophomonadaceae bacterium]|jgi:ABC-2 type transport system ATP-binding protein